MSAKPLYRPNSFFDVLSVPVIGTFLKWRWGRLAFQLLLLVVSAVIIFDGFTGNQAKPSENLATVGAWLHYRGLVVLALLFFGNLFCMGCPFTLPRTLATKLSSTGRRWPKALRNKWVALGMLFLLLFVYEWLDLWASPWLTAWVAVGYFVLAFVLEALFAESPFCKYVCPLGTFNFISATISPTQIKVHNNDICRTCTGHECINGTAKGNEIRLSSIAVVNEPAVVKPLPAKPVLGCGTELFAPQIKSNMDCIFCLDCVRACPHDNIGLALRSPLAEIKQPKNWSRRWDVSFLVLAFSFMGLSNAFGMVPPYYSFAVWLGNTLNTQNEFVILLLVFGSINLLFPAFFGLLAASLSTLLSGSKMPKSLRQNFTRYAPAVTPIGFAIWFSHYGFHFATGALSIIPVTQFFLRDIGLRFVPSPDWSLSAVMPTTWLLPIETAVLLLGFAASLYLLGERHRRDTKGKVPFLAQLPWLLLFIGLTVTAYWMFTLPMEMRGTINFLR